MSMSSENRLRLKREKQDKKRADKKKLMELAEKRKAARGAPDYGAKESDVLDLKMKVEQLIVSNNRLVEEMRKIQSEHISDKAIEAHYMMQVVLGILESKNLVTKEELNQLAQSIQLDSIGLVDKPSGVVEVGDTILFNFKLFDGDTLVEDQSAAPLAYDVGSKGLPCDDGMVGMKAGETRLFEVIFPEGFRHKELIGKPIRMETTCRAVKIKKTMRGADEPKQP